MKIRIVILKDIFNFDEQSSVILLSLSLNESSNKKVKELSFAIFLKSRSVEKNKNIIHNNYSGINVEIREENIFLCISRTATIFNSNYSIKLIKECSKRKTLWIIFFYIQQIFYFDTCWTCSTYDTVIIKLRTPIFFLT